MTQFGRQERFLSQAGEAPGVGDYDTGKWQAIYKGRTSRSVSIGKQKRRSIEENTLIPGPGTYNFFSVKKRSPNPLIIGKPRQTNRDFVPGPGSYLADPTILLRTNPKFSFSGSEIHYKYDKIPGPGQYCPDVLKIPSTGPIIKIGNEKRETKDPNAKNPGPGKYNPQLIRQDTKYSFATQTKFKAETLQNKQKGLVPGPGQYSLSSSKHLRGGKFAQGKRQSLATTCLPGPGQYEPKANTVSLAGARGFSLGSSAREVNYQTTDPGPIYSVTPVQKYKKSMRKSHMLFAKSNREHKYDTQIPGPGAYNTQSNFMQGQGVTMKGHPHTDPATDGPSPSDYNPNFTMILTRNPVATIGFSKEKPTSSQLKPGPCSYKIEDDRQVKSFYFPKFERVNHPDQTPGPGHYTLKH